MSVGKIVTPISQNGSNLRLQSIWSPAYYSTCRLFIPIVGADKKTISIVSAYYASSGSATTNITSTTSILLQNALGITLNTTTTDAALKMADITLSVS